MLEKHADDLFEADTFEDYIKFLLGSPGWEPVVLPDGSWCFKHLKSGVHALWPGGQFCNKEMTYK